jgi:hypothetical protein
MRFGEKCPCCGYTEEENWRPVLNKIQVDLIEPEESKIKIEAGQTKIIGQWVYYRTKTGKWLKRMLVPVWESWGKKFSWPKGFYDKKRHGEVSANSRLRYGRRRLEQSKKLQTKLF